MAVNTLAYDKDITALLVVDPYNDFISAGSWTVVAVAVQCSCRSGLAGNLC